MRVIITEFMVLCNLQERKFDADNAILLLLLNRVELVDLVFKPFNAFATKLSRVIMREKIVECFIA